MGASQYKYVPNQSMQIWCPHEFDLSGAAIQVPIFYNYDLPAIFGNISDDVQCIIKDWIIVYTEASSADAGVSLEIGYNGDPDYFGASTSETSKAQFYTKRIVNTSLSNDRVYKSNGKIITAYCAGGKVGTGNVRIGITLSFNYKDYKSYTP